MGPQRAHETSSAPVGCANCYAAYGVLLFRWIIIQWWCLLSVPSIELEVFSVPGLAPTRVETFKATKIYLYTGESLQEQQETSKLSET